MKSNITYNLKIINKLKEINLICVAVITDEHASDSSTFRHFRANCSSHNYILYIIVYIYVVEI